MTASKDHRVSKLYDAMTSGEKAAAVFACLMRFDTNTADRIIATVPTRTYRTLDLDYGDRLSRLSDMSSFWGLHHWREMTVMTAAMALMCRAWQTGNDDLGEQTFEGFQKAQAHLVALDAMLLDICDENGLDQEAIRMMAGVPETYTPIGEPPSDPDFDAEFRGILSKLAR
ncbi:MAG: hypothetical protein WCG85_14045 [Polyangia bacterium]